MTNILTNVGLEIHHINVGLGDATLIILRDANELNKRLIESGENSFNTLEMLKRAVEKNVLLNQKSDNTDTVIKSVLIDAGDNGVSKAAKILRYLRSMGVTQLDYILTSHYHQDHIGGYACLIKGNDVIRKKDKTNPPTCIYDMGLKIGSFKRYKEAFKEFTRTELSCQDLKKGISIDLGTSLSGANVKLTCIAMNSIVFDGTEVCIPKNANDTSIAWMLTYGAFSYVTSGDLSGFKAAKYQDIETMMIDKYMDSKGSLNHICACKLNHHGSNHSSNRYFLSKINPKVAVISTGDRFFSGTYIPHRETIIQLEAKSWEYVYNNNSYNENNTIQAYYLTNLLKDLKDPYDTIGTKNSKGKIGGDIVLIVDHMDIVTRSRYAVYCNGEKPEQGVVNNPDKIRTDMFTGIDIYDCHQSI